MAELKVSTKADLELLSNTFDHTYNYKKVIRFGDQNLVDELKQYNLTIREREEEKRKDAIYNIAAGLAMYQTPQDQSKAAEEFAKIPGYRDADKRAKNCHRQALLLAYDLALKEAQKATTATEYAVVSKKFRAIASDYPPAKEKAEEYSEKSKELAETERKDVIYAGAILAMGTDDISSIERAIEDFESISGWKDSDEQIFLCHAKIEELKAQEAEKRLKEVRLEKKTSLVFKVVSIVSVVVCAILIFAAIWNNVIVPNKYNKAIELMNQGKYTEAIAEFEKLNGYKSSENKIEICKNEIPYNKAIELMDAGKYTEAISEFEKLDAYGNSEQKIEECRRAIKYNDAISKMNSGNIIEAYEALIALDYKDSTEKAASIYYEYTVEKLKLAKAGDYVFFGSYEQDNNLSDGKEEIEWLVLEVKDGRALMISKYALAYKQYNTNEVYVAWENSSLREWLNDYFINNAFSADEKSIISEASTFANESFCYDTKLGTTTRDRVFLLSMTEIYKYFDSYSERECSLTTYALKQGAAEVDWYGNCQWWLRIPGSKDEPVYIDMDGTVSSVDNDITLYRAVRPALWVYLNS